MSYFVLYFKRFIAPRASFHQDDDLFEANFPTLKGFDYLHFNKEAPTVGQSRAQTIAFWQKADGTGSA